MPSPSFSKRHASAPGKITDPRFKSFEEDPRFRLPSSRSTKTKIDKRFSRMFKDNDFTSVARVDRYGRKLKSDTKKRALQRLYQQEDGEDGEDEKDANEDGKDEADDDKTVQRELRAVNKRYDPARGGGFSSSESEEDEDEEDEDEEREEGQIDAAAGLERFQDEQRSAELGEVTHRLAVVNLDWDNVNSTDLLALFSSFVAAGKIEKIAVFPSSFGKERMRTEEVEGPPRDIFKKSAKDDDSADDQGDDKDDDADLSDDEVKKTLIQEGEEEDFDNDALRQYQLERLRYFYAVVTCTDKAGAQKIYEATDGSEYLSSSNFLDLRFVPDDVAFDEDEPRDEATTIPPNYKPIEFVTDALFNSKVKLTWDVREDQSSRTLSIQKAFSGSRAEIAENDLLAYLASEASDSEDEDQVSNGKVEDDAEQGPEEPPLSKKELERRKIRAKLGLSDEPIKKSAKGPVGEMQITFASALSGKDSDGKGVQGEETTVEKYIRKEKERKAKRREKAVAKREGHDPEAPDVAEDEEATDDLGFDDPFFTKEEPAKTSKSAVRKEERLKKRVAKEAEAVEKAAERANLELIMADNADEDTERLEHFNMNEIMRAEKKKGKKKKKKDKKASEEDRGGLQEDFNMDVTDSRFQAVFNEHEFAIDPSNSRYKATEGMTKMLEEGRKKRKGGAEEGSSDDLQRHSKKTKGGSGELRTLIDAVKKKSNKT